MKTTQYQYENGLSKAQIESLEKSNWTNTFSHIVTEDGKYYEAKSRKYVWTHPVDEPHLRKVVAVFPNGSKANYCVNLNNGVATFMNWIKEEELQPQLPKDTNL